MNKIPRFFISDAEFSRGKFYLHDNEIIRHARKVLRLSKGDRVELFDGRGTKYVVEIDLLSKELIVATLVEEKIAEERTGLQVTLAQALPKLGKIDDILRMNTEIGVAEFVLFESDHSVVKRNDYHERKITRLNKIIREAGRQSHNDYLPSLLGPLDFESIINKQSDLKILLHTDGSHEEEDIKEIKSNLKGVESVTICIGPEGGFSQKEVELAKKHDFHIVKLNLPILRTETAGLVVSSFLLI